MIPLYDVKLVPRENNIPPFEQGKMSILLDDLGNPVVTDGRDALEQDVLKALFTGARTDGYGTLFKKMIGTKNKRVFATLGMFTAMASLKSLQGIQQRYSNSNPKIYKDSRVISSVSIINVDIDGADAMITLDISTQQESLVTYKTTVRTV